MTTAVRISNEIIGAAKKYARVKKRSAQKQIEYWAKIGQIAEENPDLPYSSIEGILLGLEEKKSGEVEEYTFG